MWKPLLVLSLLPTAVAIFLRITFCDRLLGKCADAVTNGNGRDLARNILRKAGAEDAVEVVEKRRPG